MARGRQEEERDSSAAAATQARLEAQDAFVEDEYERGEGGVDEASSGHPVASKWAAFLVRVRGRETGREATTHTRVLHLLYTWCASSLMMRTASTNSMMGMMQKPMGYVSQVLSAATWLTTPYSPHPETAGGASIARRLCTAPTSTWRIKKAQPRHGASGS